MAERKKAVKKTPALDKVRALDDTSQALSERITQLESQLSEMESGLSEGRLESYRGKVVERVRAEYAEAFRNRSVLVEPRYGNLDAWGAFRGRMRACLIVQRAVEDPASRSAQSVEELVRMIDERLGAERSRFDLIEQPDDAIRKAMEWVEEARR